MPVHYVITCGTSQIEKEKLKGSLGFSEKEAANFISQVKRAKGQQTPEVFFNEHQTEYARIVKKLIENWNKLPDLIGKEDNPFGAEISTLKAYMKDRPAEATATVLTSDSAAGYFCSRILLTLLKSKDDINIDNEPKMVGRLDEEPSNQECVNLAMVNLINLAYDALKVENPRNPETKGICNIIIASGGFKSILPGLTLFAFVYGLELVYLFEQSNLPQVLTPAMNLTDRKVREKWIDHWKFVIENGRLERASYIYQLINLRTQNPNAVFYAEEN